MKRTRAILILAAIVLMVAPQALAQSPFGRFDGQVGGGNAGAGVMRMVGWALDDDGVAAVDVFVDGLIVGRAVYGSFRPGVAAIYPGFPDSQSAGWGYHLDTTHFLNGLHTVSVRVTSTTGERTFVNSKVFEFLNTTHLLHPFGLIQNPPEDAELYGNCDTNDPSRRLSVIDGYALDVGLEENDFGVGYVELLLDGAIVANSFTSCFFATATGGLTNCYGLRSLEIERQFPLLKDSPHAGFRFVVDVGDLLNLGYNPGRHTFTMRVGDIAGQVAEVDALPVTFLCDDELGNERSFGGIDLPAEGLFFGGQPVAITGFAVDFEAVQRVEVYVDGFLQGNATLGLPRPAVATRFPGYPGVATSGWSFSLDVVSLSDGFHQLQVIVVDGAGVSHLIGERTFKVNNPGV